MLSLFPKRMAKLEFVLILETLIKSALKITFVTPQDHSKGVTLISHLKPEGLKYNLTQTIIL